MRSLVLAFIVTGVLAVAVQFGSFVAGGSDSYCYVHQAERWASGRLQVAEPLALEAPWPEASLTFAPAGHLPSPTVRGAIVPVCPPGLSMMMAPFLKIGGPRAMFFVVPLFGVLLVLATSAVGSRFGARIGLASATVMACSPIFLYQVIQPMSDVPAAALWMLAIAFATGVGRERSTLSGLAASAAILVRPNLVPLGVVIGLIFLCRPEHAPRARLREAATYAAFCVPGCIAVAVIQQAFYGSPFASGYGGLDGLFAMRNVLPNASRYGSWLVATHTPLVAIVLAAPLVLPGVLTWLCVGLILVNLGLYLPYAIFDHWSYLRFLLPTLPLLLILVMAVLDALWRRLRLPSSTAALALATTLMVALFLREAEVRNTFRLQRFESRFARTGEFVARRLPRDAFIITNWQSGSVRFYAGRKTLVWDGLPPEWLDRAIGFVRAKGFEPYLLLESWEEPLFRRRFKDSHVGALDWPPMAEIGSQVRLYRPDDRERYLRGDISPTEYAP